MISGVHKICPLYTLYLLFEYIFQRGKMKSLFSELFAACLGKLVFLYSH